jgi:hypothetical protein
MPASILDQAQPQVLVQAACLARSCHTALVGRFELSYTVVLSFDVLDPALDRRVIARFGHLGDLGGHQVQIIR